MTTFIPLFPLNIVVYPGEELNLHIFEPRYKQLISECFNGKKEFGVAPVFKNTVSEMGTSIQVVSIEKIHENGEMDIRTKGQKIFRILEHIKEIPEKLYSGSIVTYLETTDNGIEVNMHSLLNLLRKFHSLLDVEKKFKKPDSLLNAYDLAHHAGLSLEQEYELLSLVHEAQRQEYLYQHLRKMIPTIVELQHLKKRIELNGHFRKLSVNGGNEEE